MFKILILLLLIINTTAFAKNLKNHYCKTSDKLSLLYLNGVGNSEENSYKSSKHILDITKRKGPLENVANSEICSGILYNQTYGIGNSDYTDNACNLDNLKSVDFSKCYLPLFDYVETIGQKVREARSAEGLSFAWSDMVSFINEGKTDDLLRGMSNTAKIALQTFLFKRIEAKIIFSVSAIYEDETLDKIYLESKKFIQIPMADNQVEYRPTVVVSHSQGNLFYNRLHDKLKTEGNIPAKYFEEKFANLQVGSAAIKSNASIGAYHTAGNDKVIHTALGTVFAVREPDIWVIKPSADDGANHSFIDTYSNNKVLITDKESVFDEYKQTGNYDAAQLENTEDVFYEKLNRLASQVVMGDVSFVGSFANRIYNFTEITGDINLGPPIGSDEYFTLTSDMVDSVQIDFTSSYYYKNGTPIVIERYFYDNVENKVLKDINLIQEGDSFEDSEGNPISLVKNLETNLLEFGFKESNKLNIKYRFVQEVVPNNRMGGVSLIFYLKNGKVLDVDVGVAHSFRGGDVKIPIGFVPADDIRLRPECTPGWWANTTVTCIWGFNYGSSEYYGGKSTFRLNPFDEKKLCPNPNGYIDNFENSLILVDINESCPEIINKYYR